MSRAIKFKKLLENKFNDQKTFPLHSPFFSELEKKYLIEAVNSTFVSSSGKMINSFESKISELTQTKYNVACINGTAALHISLLVAGVKPGDEVITQALSFVATSNAISYVGATPVFIDVDLDTFGMSPDSLNNFLEEFGRQTEEGTFNKKTGKKISACIPMHTFGFMCRIDQIKSICKKWNIHLIEDAAEALGSKYKGISAGKFGLVSSFSFNGNKIITTGGGGCITTQHKRLYEKAKHITTTAKSSNNWEYIHDEIGFNYKMPNINAALGLGQIENFSQKLNSKKLLYELYQDSLYKIGIELTPIPKNTSWNYWLMSVKLPNKKERDHFLKTTNFRNIQTRPIWRLLFKLPMYSKCQKDGQQNAKILENTIVNIPSNLKVE